MWVIRSEYIIHVGDKIEYMWVPINAKGGDCWKIQLTDSEFLSLMATVKMTGKQKTSSER
jgi:hypothetical protein